MKEYKSVVIKIEEASHQVADCLDAMVGERANVMMKDASISLFKNK